MQTYHLALTNAAAGNGQSPCPVIKNGRVKAVEFVIGATSAGGAELIYVELSGTGVLGQGTISAAPQTIAACNCSCDLAATCYNQVYQAQTDFPLTQGQNLVLNVTIIGAPAASAIDVIVYVAP